MLNGNGALDTSTHRLFARVREQLAVDRFQVLADAVADHQTRAGRFSSGPLPHDRDLYRRLRELQAHGGDRLRGSR